MGRENRSQIIFSIFFIGLLLTFIIPSFSVGQEEKEIKDLRPARGVEIFTEYSGVVVSKGEGVRMNLILVNKGRSDETIDVKISTIPKGWKAILRGATYVITGTYVPNGKSKDLALSLEPEKTVGPGSYVFQFDAQTADGKFTSSHTLTVTVKEGFAGMQDIQINTSYPVLRGQTDAKFEFSIDVVNKSESDRTFNLSALGPERWEINFKPAYETKQITSIQVKGGQSQTVAVEVSPPKNATAGQYPILISASSGEKRTEARLTVVLTGIYQLDAGTPTGLLSLEVNAGKPTIFSLFVRNTGSAVNRNITFYSFKAEKWEVKYNPEKIDKLEPGEQKVVEVTIKPSADALVGDYSINCTVEGENRSSKVVEMRVTVKASTTWVWIGVGIILFVIVGLVGLFIWLGRR